METVVMVMMIVVCFNYIVKQTFRKAYFVAVSAVVCALFVGLAWPWAIEQSKNQIAGWLADSALMLDMAVLLTLEVALQMTFCVVTAHIHTAGRVKTSIVWTYRLLRWFPGLLIFPVLFSALVALIFAFPGVSFSLLSWSMAAGILILIPAGTWLLRRVMPEKDVRLELLFLVNALIAVLGVVATVNGRTAVAGMSEVDWSALAALVVIIVLGALAGFVAYRIKLKKKAKKHY